MTHACRHAGFTLIESMMLIVVMGIIAAAAGTCLQAAARTPRANNATLMMDTAMLSQMETLRATPFDNLAIGLQTATVSIEGKDYTMTTDIELADPAGGSSPQTSFKQITVQLGSESLCTQVSDQ